MLELVVDEHRVLYDHFPDTCPICNHGILPEFRLATFVGEPDSTYTKLEIVFKCPRRECSRNFVDRYRRNFMESISGPFRFDYAVPQTFMPPQFSEEIKTIFPNFVEIYGQAAGQNITT